MGRIRKDARMTKARADHGDGQLRFAPQLSTELVEKLSGSAAVRSLVDAMSGAIVSRFEGLIPTLKGPDLIGQLGRDAASPFEGLIPNGPDLTRRLTDLIPTPKGPDLIGRVDLSSRFESFFPKLDLMKLQWATAGSVLGPDLSAGPLAGLSSSLVDGVGSVFADHRRLMDGLLSSVAPSVGFGDPWLGRAALRLAVSAKQAVLRGDVDAVRWFVRHWLNFTCVPATLVDAASAVLLDESAWMPAEDAAVGYDPRQRLRALTITAHRNHRLIGNTQLCGRRVWSLDEPVPIGSGDVKVPRVELVPSPPLPCDEITDPRLIRLLGELSERERRILWAWLNEGSWYAAAESCGATRAEANNVRRKVNRLCGRLFGSRRRSIVR
jgi:hypothetical protein